MSVPKIRAWLRAAWRKYGMVRASSYQQLEGWHEGLKLEYERLKEDYLQLSKQSEQLTRRYAEYRKSMETVHRPTNLSGVVTKFDLEEALSGWYGHHQGGWNYVVSGFTRFANNPEGVLLEPFVERRFFWHPDLEILGKPYGRPWVGFIHCPPRVPQPFPQMGPEQLFSNSAFQESLTYCKGLFVLSECLRDYLLAGPLAGMDCQVEIVRHPTEPAAMHFQLARFETNRCRRIVQIGTWLRNLSSIYKIATPEHLRRSILLGEAEWIRQIHNLQCEVAGVTQEEKDQVDELQPLTSGAYDRLLAENIVFVDLIDASATNTILECVERNTPIILRRIPAAEEYLGRDYPGFFDKLEEADTLLSFKNIRRTHEYLLAMDKAFLRLDYFLESIFSSQIYLSLPETAG